jgi:hypothetical protein
MSRSYASFVARTYVGAGWRFMAFHMVIENIRGEQQGQ